MSDGSLRGNLADASYGELLKSLCDQGQTGRLVLRRDHVSKVTYLREGRLVFARSSDPNDRLGEFLLRLGSIRLADYLGSAAQIGPGKRQGGLLCELGAVAADELVKLVKAQVTEIVLTQFEWRAGVWEFAAGAEEVGEMIVLNMPTEDVIVMGARRVTDWAKIWSGIGASTALVFAQTPVAHGLRYRSGLEGNETHLLGLIDGKLPLGRLLELGYGSDYETCRTLWGFRVAGAIAPSTEVIATPQVEDDWDLAEKIECYDRVFTFIHGFVSERIGDLVDHFFDQAIEASAARHPRVLAGVLMRNQGRIEYEDVFVNLAREPVERRRELTAQALDELLLVLLALTGKELGRDEEILLREHLLLLAREIPDALFTALLRRAPDPSP